MAEHTKPPFLHFAVPNLHFVANRWARWRAIGTVAPVFTHHHRIEREYTMAHSIFSGTPTWVWFLLVALAWLGLRQTMTQTASLRRVTLMPLALVALSLYGTVTVFGDQPLALLVWAKAAAATAYLVMRRPVAPGTRFDLSSQTFTLPGTWAPLALMMTIFCTKYAVGITQAIQPSLLHSTAVALVVSTIYGLSSGVLIGRALRLWRLAMAADAAWHGQTQPAATAA